MKIYSFARLFNFSIMSRPLMKLSADANKVLFEVLTNPNLPEQLACLHDLALYDSGDALLGPEEKQALFSIRQLALSMRRMKRAERYRLRKILRKNMLL